MKNRIEDNSTVGRVTGVAGGAARKANAILKRAATAFLLLTAMATAARASEADDPLTAWRTGVNVRPLSTQPGRHTTHTYYLMNPESPDGSRVLFFASTAPEGEHGDIVVLDRATGKETVIARNIDTEDAHRVALQQWVSGGRRVAYHDVKDGRWSVHVVDLETGIDRKLVEDRQLSFGRPDHDVVPIYGLHWNPGAHRDLELLNVVTGEIRTVLTMSEVEGLHRDWLTKQFGDKPTSIAFPTVSPDGKRVFFKISAQEKGAATNDFKAKNLTQNRKGLLAYDLVTKKSLFVRDKWGHPAWHPDSRRILERGNLFFDTDKNGEIIRMLGLPSMTNHPSMAPDGRLFVTDGLVNTVGGPPGHWGIAVCDVRGNHYEVLHRFDNSKGARTWRKNHPHPIFSADGKRIYFNVNEGKWTQLFVAEVATKR